jgi:integrase
MRWPGLSRQKLTLTPDPRRCIRRLDLRAPPHVVREIAGHSDTEVTMTIYAHVSLEEEVQGARQPRRGALG